MTTKKSPSRIRARAEKNEERTTSLYSVESSSVNICWNCPLDYFRATVSNNRDIVSDARHQSTFCAFTGEAVHPESVCHVAVAGVAV